MPAGVSVPSCLSFRPPKNSLASFWNTTQDPSTEIFALNQIGIGTVIDVLLEVSEGDSVSSSTAYQITTSTMTAGKFYFLSLDGVGGVLYPSNLVRAP